jgi:glycosyltransferase involved in cell wall biosynthesis
MKKVKILFVSAHIVHNASAMAGNQTFNYYLSRFANDASFEVGYVVVHKKDSNFQKMDAQFQTKTKSYAVASNLLLRAFNYLMYNTPFRGLLSMIIPDWYYINDFYASFYIKGVKKAKAEKWLPDIVVLEWTESLFMYKKIAQIFPKAKYVCSEHDVAFVSVERNFSEKGFLQRQFVKRFKKKELSLLSRMDKIAVHNKKDYSRLLDNGISAHKLLTIAPFFGSYVTSTDTQTFSNSILYFGAMNREENIHAVEWFINKVFVPFKLYDDFTFIVVGGKGEQLREKYANHGEKIVFTGYVEDPGNYFATSLCMVAPLFYGAGIKVKVIEGMSSRLPVLTSYVGIEGIEAEDKHDYFLCNTAEEFYNTIKELGSNKKLAVSVGQHAAGFVKREFNYHQSYEHYKSQLAAMVVES